MSVSSIDVQKQRIDYILPLLLLSVGMATLGILQFRIFGWSLLILAVAFSSRLPAIDRRRYLTIMLSVALLALMPASASLSPLHIIIMSLSMLGAVILPFFILKVQSNDPIIKYTFHHGRSWYKTEILYILFTAFIAYLTLPIYFASTGQYENWQVSRDLPSLILLFISLIAVGIWDELFFIATILGIYKNYLSFWVANLLQAFIFASFLFELGFRSWGVFVAYLFALIQGYVFKRTNSLIYAITIHVVFDVVLFMALVHAHYPDIFTFIITG